MTLYFSFIDYNLLVPGGKEFVGFLNYEFFLTDPAFFESFFNTLYLVTGGFTYHYLWWYWLSYFTRPSNMGTKLRSHYGTSPIFCNANCVGIGMEKHANEPS
jgi:ABC-type sugar transport system permease subunit